LLVLWTTPDKGVDRLNIFFFDLINLSLWPLFWAVLLYFSDIDVRNGRRVEEKQEGKEAPFLRRWEWYENEDSIFVSSSQFRLEPQNFHFMFNAELCNLES